MSGATHLLPVYIVMAWSGTVLPLYMNDFQRNHFCCPNDFSCTFCTVSIGRPFRLNLNSGKTKMSPGYGGCLFVDRNARTESAVCASLCWVKKRLSFRRIFGHFIFTASVTKGDSLDSRCLTSKSEAVGY